MQAVNSAEQSVYTSCKETRNSGTLFSKRVKQQLRTIPDEKNYPLLDIHPSERTQRSKVLQIVTVVLGISSESAVQPFGSSDVSNVPMLNRATRGTINLSYVRETMC